MGTVKIGGVEISVGDAVKIRYESGTWSKGATVEGIVTKIWNEPNVTQAQINNKWCFHDGDSILSHSKSQVTKSTV